MEFNEVIALIYSVDARINELLKNNEKPRKSQLIADLNREWQLMEDELTKREHALKIEVLKQEKLVQLAYNFKRKVSEVTHILDA